MEKMIDKIRKLQNERYVIHSEYKQNKNFYQEIKDIDTKISDLKSLLR